MWFRARLRNWGVKSRRAKLSGIRGLPGPGQPFLSRHLSRPISMSAPLLPADYRQLSPFQIRLCQAFIALRESSHLTVTAAARALGRSPSTFSGKSSLLSRYVNSMAGEPRPVRGAPASDLSKRIEEELPWFVPAARWFYAHSSPGRDRTRLRQAITSVLEIPRLPQGWSAEVRQRFLKAIGVSQVPACPEWLKVEVAARRVAGRDPMPHHLARLIKAGFAGRTEFVFCFSKDELDGVSFQSMARDLTWMERARRGEQRPGPGACRVTVEVL